MIYCPQKREVNINTLEFFEIEDIKEDILITKDKYIRILKIHPINYDLKSQFEKEAIINSYKTVLKTCNFDFQILIISEKENIDKNIELINDNLFKRINEFNNDKLLENIDIRKVEEKENRLNTIYSNYINFIEKLVNDENITSKSFYIIIYENKNKNKKEENIIKEKFIRFIKKTEDKEEKQNLFNTNNKYLDYIKTLNDKEKKLIVSLSKCGNQVIRLNGEEIYKLFNINKVERSKI